MTEMEITVRFSVVAHLVLFPGSAVLDYISGNGKEKWDLIANVNKEPTPACVSRESLSSMPSTRTQTARSPTMVSKFSTTNLTTLILFSMKTCRHRLDDRSRGATHGREV